MVVINLAHLSSLLEGQAGSAKAWNLRLRRNAALIKSLCCLVFVVWILRLTFSWRPSLSPMFGKRVQALDAQAHEIWFDYIRTHPVEVDERYGFREMGFRAHAYAELARTQQIGMLETIEENMWSFALGAAQIRRDALHVAPVISQSQKDPNVPVVATVESKVKAILKKSGSLSANQTAALLPAAQLEDESRGGKRRGIVMTVNRQTALAAVQTITVLRELYGCLLPVEIYFHTEDELPAALVDMFQSMGRVSAFDIDTLPIFTGDLEDDAGRYPASKEAWERQSLALLASSFQEILIIDPRVVFCRTQTSSSRTRPLPAPEPCSSVPKQSPSTVARSSSSPSSSVRLIKAHLRSSSLTVPFGRTPSDRGWTWMWWCSISPNRAYSPRSS